jgi:hypothetical protein
MNNVSCSYGFGAIAKWMAPVALWCSLMLPARAQTVYYVDSSRTVNGVGTLASPWTNWSLISWTAVSNAVSNGNVTVYFSSRSTMTSTADYTPKTSGLSANQMIQFIGNAFYNTNLSGAAVWQPETNGNRVFFTGAFAGTNYYGGTVLLNANTCFVSFKGIHITNAVYGCFNMSSVNPTTNVHDIYLTNCVFDTPQQQYGVFGGYLETNCYNFVISGCFFTNSLYEPIYMGHYCYFAQTITNVIIESNLIANCGQGSTAYHQGQINIKPGVYGAILRYNTEICTMPVRGGSCGVECFGDYTQIYGNTFMNESLAYDGTWGYGILLSGDGDYHDAPNPIGPGEGNPALTSGQGSPITSCLIYNNIIANCGCTGIQIYATTPLAGAGLSGLQIWNNTIWGNATNGIDGSIDLPQTMTIAQMENNIIGNDGGMDVYLPMNITLASADCNLYWRPSGTNWDYDRSYSIGSFAAWQALGFDLHGTNAAPLFVDATNANPFLRNFALLPASPGLAMGAPSGFFTADMLQAPRPVANWEVGPIQVQFLAPPAGLRVVSD